MGKWGRLVLKASLVPSGVSHPGFWDPIGSGPQCSQQTSGQSVAAVVDQSSNRGTASTCSPLPRSPICSGPWALSPPMGRAPASRCPLIPAALAVPARQDPHRGLAGARLHWLLHHAELPGRSGDRLYPLAAPLPAPGALRPAQGESVLGKGPKDPWREGEERGQHPQSAGV